MQRDRERWLERTLGLFLPALVLVANLRPVWGITVDDAFISLRYARNLARGLGLVYGAGARVEGYTNFSWTLLIAGAMRLGLDGERAAHLLGAAAAIALLCATWALAARLRPFSRVPCLATWLLATSVPLDVFAASGLETPLYAFLCVAAAARLHREVTDGGAPWSGLLFGLAALTRPEAPLVLAVLVLTVAGVRPTRQGLLRLVMFAAPVVAHLAFRRAYYGRWLPQTFWAKVHEASPGAGAAYAGSWAAKEWPLLVLASAGAVLAVRARHRFQWACVAVAGALIIYIVSIGGDWMPGWRHLVVVEPFVFVLADAGVRELLERAGRRGGAALLAVLAVVAVARVRHLRLAQRQLVLGEERTWQRTAGATAAWLRNRPAGGIAIADIGRVGWVTDAPIVDLGRLTDRAMPVGPSRQLVDHVLAASPRYLVVIASDATCVDIPSPQMRALVADPRVNARFRLAWQTGVEGASWCVFAAGD